MSLSPQQQFARQSLLRWHKGKNYARSDMLPRMSWDPANLYNIWERATQYSPESWRLGQRKITVQRTFARRLVLGYHCQHVTSPQLRRKYLRVPPTYRIKAFKRQTSEDSTLAGLPFTDSRSLPAVPYYSMLFSEIERRLDSVLFRSCLVPSIYEARRLIAKAVVKVEGSIVRSPGFALEPGMMFSVEPKHLTWGLDVDWEARLKRLKEHIRVDGWVDRFALGRFDPSDEPAVDHALTEEPAASSTEEAPSTTEADKLSADKNSVEDMTKEQQEPAALDKNKSCLEFRLPEWAAPMIFVPAYLEVNFRACAGIYVRHPTAKPGVSEIPSPWDSAGGEMFQLFHEYWRPLLKKHRVRPTLAPGMKRNVWKRENERQRDIGQGDALTIQHLDRIRRATREADEAFIQEASKEEQSGRRSTVQKIRNLRQQRYIAGRLATEAVPLEKARRVPLNRVNLLA